MRSIDQDSLKVIQLEIMDAFHRFCVENGIRYSLSCGTLLGAVRHGGYIPWDDDIDLCLLREDYDRLLREFPDVLEGLYRLGAIQRDGRWDHPYAKVYDCSTVMHENRIDAVEIGVNIDVFPIDRLPESPLKRRIHVKRCSLLYHAFIAKDRMLGSPRAWWKTIVLAAVKVLLLPWSKQALCRRIEKALSRWNTSGSAMAADLDVDFNLSRTFEVSLFEKMGDIQFEGHTFRAFADYDRYLTSVYGDYMQLPPVSQRVSHHRFEAFYKD